MKVVYITGCLGLIGSYLTRLCLSKGYYVIGIDKITYAARPHLLKEFHKYEKFKFEEKDICDLDRLVDCDYFINVEGIFSNLSGQSFLLCGHANHVELCFSHSAGIL